MNYAASVTDFFKSPKWVMNLLLGGVCMLIPVVGPIVLSGWIIGLLWGRGADNDPAKAPPFEFNQFEKYLKRGLWPFLVQLVAGLAIGFLVGILMVVISIVIAVLGKIAAILASLMFLVVMLLYVVFAVGINFVLIPLSLKATLTQDFGPAFDFAFVKSFISTVWKEILITALFMLALGIVYIIGTFITLFIGAYFLLPVLTYSWQHLAKQLYQLHLERGGIEVALSPKLNDLPPVLPQATA